MAEPRGIQYAVAAAAAGAMLTYVAITLNNRVEPAPIHIETVAPTALPTATPTQATLRVYVSGEVVSPDVYMLPPGSIMRDAVEAAGGFTSDADPVAVNLAQPLQDGVQIWVPPRAATVERVIVATPAAPLTDAERAAPTLSTTIVLVNINTADEALLQGLPGIGPVLAGEIVSFREINGPFASIEEILQVPGIGPGRYGQIQALITTE